MKSLQDGYELREHRSMPTQQSRDDERHLRRENVIGEDTREGIVVCTQSKQERMAFRA